MSGSSPRRMTCGHCGSDLGFGGYVEISVIDHSPETVEGAGGTRIRWRSKPMMTEYVCPVCAIGAVDRIKEKRA